MLRKNKILVWFVVHFIVLFSGGSYLVQKGNLLVTAIYCIFVIVSWFGGHIQLVKEPQEYDAKLAEKEQKQQ